MKLLKSYFLICIITTLVVHTSNAQWVPTNGPLEGLTLSLALSTSEAGDTTIFAGTWGGWVFKTTNNGNSWTEIDGGARWRGIDDTGFTRQDIRYLATVQNGDEGACLFAVNKKGKLFRSLHSDTNWNALSNNIANHPVSAILIQDTNIFIGTDSGVFRSTDLGSTWTIFKNELTPFGVYSLALDSNGTGSSNTLFATTSGGIYRSTNKGENWIVVYTNPDEVMDYYNLVVGRNSFGGISLYALRSGLPDIFCSTDSGVTWNTLSRLDPYFNYSIRCIAVHDTIIYVSANGDGPSMYYSLNRGKNWVVGNYGIGRQRSIHSFLTCGKYIYAACASDIGKLNGVWKRPLAEMLTAVRDKDKYNPTQFVLEQNYPNPFNPATVISYRLSNSGHVVLKVYDVLGREVETLVSAQQSSGIYTVDWRALDIPSGTYFYRLTTGNVTQTKK